MSIFIRTFLMVFLMEMGSASNFTIAASAVNSDKPILIWLAGALALLFTTFLAVKLGGLLNYLPVSPNLISGVILLVSGLYFLWKC